MAKISAVPAQVVHTPKMQASFLAVDNRRIFISCLPSFDDRHHYEQPPGGTENAKELRNSLGIIDVFEHMTAEDDINAVALQCDVLNIESEIRTTRLQLRRTVLRVTGP